MSDYSDAIRYAQAAYARQAEIAEMNRRQHDAAQAEALRQTAYNQQAQFTGGINREAHAFWGQRSAPSRPRSRFDTPDVIDMVQGADGVWREPVLLEDRARER